jgi:hypothetical protein
MRDGIEKIGTQSPERKLDWLFVHDTAEQQEVEDALLIRLSESVEFDKTNSSIVLMDASQTRGLLFNPPWRDNPLKLRDFLRGQKVPLHLQGCTPVLFLDQQKVIAVFIKQPGGEHHFSGKAGRWIVDAQFSVERERVRHQTKLVYSIGNENNCSNETNCCC